MSWWAIARSTANVPISDAYWFRDVNSTFGNGDFTKAGHPFGMTGLDTRISTTNYNGRTYGCGGFTGNWLNDENFALHPLGMIAPDSIATLAAAAGTDINIGYVSFWDDFTQERSPLSAPTPAVTGIAPFSWSGLPTVEVGGQLYLPGTTVVNASTSVVGVGTSFMSLRVGDQIALSSALGTSARILTITDDTHLTTDVAIGNGTTQTMLCTPVARATHIELWRSVNGALPRLAVRRNIGVATASESIATLALGIAFTTAFTQFPRCSFNALYHQRLVMAGNPESPGTLYLSDVTFPERYVLLSFNTLNGEAITGLLSVRDSLLVYTAKNTYILRGYTSTDMVLAIADYDLGAISHWAIDVIYGHAWVANEQGVFLWDGQYHPMLIDRETEWGKDFKLNEAAFNQGFCYHDQLNYTWSFVVPGYLVSSLDQTFTQEIMTPNVGTVAWVANYQDALPETSGSFAQPDWSMDIMAATWRCCTRLSNNFSGRGTLTAGFCNGFVYQMDPTNADDSGDLYQKRFYVRGPHYFFADPGGDLDEGKKFTRFWTYIEAEQSGLGPNATAFTVTFIGGDEQAFQQGAGNAFSTAQPVQADNSTFFWKNDVLPSLLVININGRAYHAVPQEVHVHVPENVSGRGLTPTVIAVAPLSLIFKGFGGIYGPGSATRGGYSTGGI